MEEELRDDFLRWPRELVELKIASDLKEGSRIARLLRNSRQRLNDPELLAVFARNRTARLELVSQAEPVLGSSDLADVACSLHSTICEQLDVPEPLLDAADDAARRSLLSGLDPAPRSKDEHRERAMALSRVSWLTVRYSVARATR